MVPAEGGLRRRSVIQANVKPRSYALNPSPVHVYSCYCCRGGVNVFASFSVHATVCDAISHQALAQLAPSKSI